MLRPLNKMLMFLLLVFFGTIFEANGDTIKVTNEDIRDAILSIINRARTTEEKLERHEIRERVLGDQIKKMLVTLDKRTKILDYVKGSINNFDRRIANIESLLSSSGAIDKDQAKKTEEIAKDIKNLPISVEKFKNDVIQEIKASKTEIPQQQSVSQDDINNVQTILSSKMDSLTSSVQKIQSEVLTLKTQSQDEQNFNKETHQHLENITLNLGIHKKLLEEYETKLEAFSNCSKVTNINKVLEKQKNDTEMALREIKIISGKVKSLPEKRDFQTTCGSVTSSINSLKSTINGQSATTKKLFDDKTKSVLDRINKIPPPKPSVTKDDINVAQKIVLNKVDSFSQSMRNIQNELGKLKDEHGNAQQIHKQTNEHIEKTKAHFDNIQDVLIKYRNKLDEYNTTLGGLPENIVQAVDKKCNANEVLTQLKEKINELPGKSDLEISRNLTLISLEYLKTDITQEVIDTKKIIQEKNKYLVAKVNTLKIPTSGISKEDIKTLSDKIDPLKTSMGDVQEELSKLKREHENAANITSRANEHMETVKMRLDNNEELLEKYETKLAKYNENIEVIQQNDKAENGWHKNIMEVLEKQKIDVDEILIQVRSVSDKVKQIPGKDDLNISKNETLKSIDNLKMNVSRYFNNSKALLEEKINTTLEKIKDIKESISGPGLSKEDVKNVLADELKTLNVSIHKMYGSVSKMQGGNYDFQKLEELAKENLEQIHDYLNDSNSLLGKYEDKLVEFGNNIEILMFDKEDETNCCANISEVLKTQSNLIQEVQGEIKIILDTTKTLPKMVYMDTLHNQTLNTIEDLRMNISKNFKNSDSIRDKKVDKLLENIEYLHKNNTELSQNVSNSIDMLITNLATSHQQLTDQVGALSNLEQVVLNAADGIIDTKRTVQYGVERILLEVGDMVKSESKKVNSTINERFDTFQTTLVNEVKHDFNNLTLGLGDDIDQIWRQIGTMHQQMKQNADVLNMLQGETDTYVNGSLNAMNSLKMKFSKVSNKTSEIDESVNYLMGKLFLMSSEFKGIQIDLGNVLDDIKAGIREINANVRNKNLDVNATMFNEVSPDY